MSNLHPAEQGTRRSPAAEEHWRHPARGCKGTQRRERRGCRLCVFLPARSHQTVDRGSNQTGVVRAAAIIQGTENQLFEQPATVSAQGTLHTHPGCNTPFSPIRLDVVSWWQAGVVRRRESCGTAVRFELPASLLGARGIATPSGSFRARLCAHQPTDRHRRTITLV